MYRVKKALNHNAVVAIDAEKCQEFLILGKGIGFGKKVTEHVEPRAEDTVYSMKECTERGEAEDIVNEVSDLSTVPYMLMYMFQVSLYQPFL